MIADVMQQWLEEEGCDGFNQSIDEEIARQNRIGHTHNSARLATLKREKFDIVIVDSIQTLWAPSIEAAPGTVSQLKAGSEALVRFALGAPVSEPARANSDKPAAGSENGAPDQLRAEALFLLGAWAVLPAPVGRTSTSDAPLASTRAASNEQPSENSSPPISARVPAMARP